MTESYLITEEQNETIAIPFSAITEVLPITSEILHNISQKGIPCVIPFKGMMISVIAATTDSSELTFHRGTRLVLLQPSGTKGILCRLVTGVAIGEILHLSHGTYLKEGNNLHRVLTSITEDDHEG